MKITFVLNRGYSLFHDEPADTFGGAQVDQYMLGLALSRKGHQVSFIFHDYGQADREQVHNNIVLYKSYPPKDTGNLVLQYLRAWKKLHQALRRTGADAYFAESANFELFFIALYCRLHGKKLFYRVASDIEVDGRYTRAHVVQGWLFTAGIKMATKIIVQTERQREALEKRGSRSTLISNAYPDKKLSGERQGVVLWVGRLIRIKRPELFLDLADRLPDKRFVLIGQMESIDQDYAKAILERIHKTKNVQYVPKVGFDEIDSYFQRASILVNSSTYEGFPVTFLQAMSLGIPIISFGVNPDGVLEKLGGLCVKNIEEVVQGVQHLQKPDIWQTTHQRSRNYFLKQFSLDLVIDRYEELFQKNALR